MENVHGRPARLVASPKVISNINFRSIFIPCGHVDVLDNVIVKCGCTSMVELLVGEVEPSIKQSPYLPLTDDDDDNDDKFISDDPLLDENFDDCHSKKEDTNSLVVTKEQESNSASGGIQVEEQKEPLFQLGILKYIFSTFKTTLTKDKWQEYPTEQYALVWCLRSLKVIL